MTVKHTPGPLHVEEGDGRWDDDGEWNSVVIVTASADEVIAELLYRTGDADAETIARADAALFAAAPALADQVAARMETCRNISGCGSPSGNGECSACASDREVLRAAGRLP